MKYKYKNILVGFTNFVFGTIAVGLFLRFIFRLFGGDPVGFAEFLYESTAPLLSPFRGIFDLYVISGDSVLEFSTLIAILIYAVISWLIVELIELITYKGSKTYRK